jgi:hypothetical protein
MKVSVSFENMRAEGAFLISAKRGKGKLRKSGSIRKRRRYKVKTAV